MKENCSKRLENLVENVKIKENSRLKYLSKFKDI